MRKKAAAGIRALLGAAVAAGAALNGAAADPGCELVEMSLRRAESIRGLTAKRAVPCHLRSEAQVREHLMSLIGTKIPAEKIVGEGELYKAVGLLPESFDYKEGLVNLYVSQLGGYYDPEAKYFVMAAWMPVIVQAPIVVHELTHALQDHHFDLERYVGPSVENGDALLARSAVAEGDAMAVMIDDSRLSGGQPQLQMDKNVDLIIAQNVLGMALMGSLREVPEALKGMLVFPYTSGLRFVHALLRRGGYRAVDGAFRRPPRSTEEILHPELYNDSAPSFIVFDDAGAPPLIPGGGVVVYGDVMGEFLVGAVMAGLSPDKAAAARAAAGWGGDRATLVDQAGTGKRLLVWRLHFDSIRDLAEFCEFYRAVKPGPVGGGSIECRGQDAVIIREVQAPSKNTI